MKPPFRSLAAALVAAVLLGAGVPALAAGAVPFSDFQASAWWATDVQVANYLQLLQGYPDGTFRPDANITRAEFATVLDRAAGYGHQAPSSTQPFVDVSASDWFAPYVDALVKAQIIRPGDYPGGKLDPNAPISRAEMAAWIGRVLAAKGTPPADLGKLTPLDALSPASQAQIESQAETPYSALVFDHLALPAQTQHPSFPDLPASTPGYASIMRAAEYGVVQGFPNGAFEPDAPATRAQAAKMVAIMTNELTANPPTVSQLQTILEKSFTVATGVLKKVPEPTILPHAQAQAMANANDGKPAADLPDLPGTTIAGSTIVADLQAAGMGDYLTRNAIAATDGAAYGMWDGRLLSPKVWYETYVVPACRPIFLGSTVAELDCVVGGDGYLWDGQPISANSKYGGEQVFFLNRNGAWKVTVSGGYASLPSWYTGPQYGSTKP